jgi:hypothetical protein
MAGYTEGGIQSLRWSNYEKPLRVRVRLVSSVSDPLWTDDYTSVPSILVPGQPFAARFRRRPE